LFFPACEPALGTLGAGAPFAAGSLARPLGAAVFGHLGDTRGRKSMPYLTLLCMGLATAAIGLLPTYAKMGSPAVLPGVAADGRAGRVSSRQLRLSRGVVVDVRSPVHGLGLACAISAQP